MKPIPGFPGYHISEDGVITNPKGKILTRKDQWEGYPRARLKNAEGKFVNRKIHRLVALAHLGVKDGEIRHKDNNRANVAVHNLEWGNRFSNAADRLARGSYHMKTKLVGGKSLLILGDDKYLDPEAKKVYHVTDHPIGEDGVIPITSLEKVAKAIVIDDNDLSRIQNVLNNYYKRKQQEKKAGLFDKRGLARVAWENKYKYKPKPIINNIKNSIENEGFVKRESLLPDQLRAAKYSKAYQNAGFIKAIQNPTAHQLDGMRARKAWWLKQQEKTSSWTSDKNADKHALKHADKMGLTKEQYIALAKAALKEKKSLISTRGDVHKSRHGKNILVHKDGKVITYYSKVAYVRRLKRHLNKGVDNFKDWGYHQDTIQTYQDVKEKRKKK